MDITSIIIAIVSSSALSTLITVIANAIISRRKKDDDMRAGVRMALYFQIKQTGLQYIKSGKIAPDDLEALIDAHKAYKSLDGDGFCDGIVNQCKNLPISL